ncbi:Nup93/Nic96-domain-containing protein [Lipomyces oligophaga]|uniref:Nup93/Nic96-domain-containing protein n=1 Tax=Lipomyces oligophaga TaxID=45792 RepID=UPI0034CF212C
MSLTSTAVAATSNVPSVATAKKPSGTTDGAGTGEKFRTSVASLLNQLLENTKSLPRNTTGLGDINLGVGEITAQARVLREHAGPSTDGDTKAHYLLAGSGINAEDIAQDLDTIVLKTTLEPLSTISGSLDTDVAGYLRYKRDENIVNSIEESVKQTTRKFDDFVNANIRLDWNYEKLLVCEHFGLVPRGTAEKLSSELGISNQSDGSATEKMSVSATEESNSKFRSQHGSAGWKTSSLGRSVLGPVSGPVGFADVGAMDLQQQQSQQSGQFQQQQPQSAVILQNRRIRYAQVVSTLNNFRLEGQLYPLVGEFADVARSMGADSRTQQIYDSWLILEGLLPAETPERYYSKMYCESSDDSPEGIKMRRLIAGTSRRYLENQFFDLVETEIAKYPQEAELGGIPSVVNKILAYLKLRFAKNGNWVKANLEIINNVPVWGLIYYMFRSGHIQEALDFTLENQSYFQKIERTFPSYLKAYAKADDNRLPRELGERLLLEFNNHIRLYDPKTDDPFKFALYKLLGRCELSRKNMPEVLLVAEDWMWAQLKLIEDSPAVPTDVFGMSSSERYTLNDLRNILVQLGSRHFNPRGTNVMLYFQILLLSGQYERAVHYLYRTQPIDAVHFAIALAYYGLLRVSADAETLDVDLMTLDTYSQRPEINFARLIGYYTRDFRREDPINAFDYLALICLNWDLTKDGKGEKYITLCHEAIREMVLETREFSKLLGDVRSDGRREPGVIERKMALIRITNETDFLQTITQQAALQADQDGRVANAILLYHLSEEYDTVMKIVNKTLGELLAVVDLTLESGISGTSLSLAGKDSASKVVDEVIQVYFRNSEILSHLSPVNREACKMLIGIRDARLAYEEGDWESCLTNIIHVNVLPLEMDNDTGSIRRRAQQFSGLDDNVARNVPMLLVMTMECCVRLTRQMDSIQYADSTRTKKIAELRIRAKNCMIYAGMIQYRIPREVCGRLTTMETEL